MAKPGGFARPKGWDFRRAAPFILCHQLGLTRVTENGVFKFRQALPHCQIEWAP